MSDDDRRVIQLATSATTIGGGNSGEFDLDDKENLYALDSLGNIYQWMYESNTHTSGWMEVSVPWHEPSKPKSSKKKSDSVEDIATWLESLGDNWPDVPSEIARRIRAGEWRKK
jgi:hypothetical protein